MPITAPEVSPILLKEIPDFSERLQEHRSEWGEDHMLYLLLPGLLEIATKSVERAPQIYAVVERMLAEGDEEVVTAFAIEMVEPLADDASEGLCFLPDLCFAMGPATLKVFQEMRDWQPAALKRVRLGEPPGRAFSNMTMTSSCVRESRITLHGLRDTHASPCAKAGVPLEVVSQRLGKASHR